METQFNNPNSTPVVYGRGEQTECEICGEVHTCYDKFGLITCQDCQSKYLPSDWML